MKKTFVVSLKYWDPVEGTAYFTADDEDDARAKALKLFAEHRDLEVVSVDESPVSQLEMDLSNEQSALPSPEDFAEFLESMASKPTKGEMN